MQQENQVVEKLGQAMSMAQSNQVQEAKNILDDLYRNNPGHEDVCCMLGIIYIQLKDYVNAEIHFNKLVSINSSNIQGYYYLGEVLSARNDFEKAAKCYIESAELMPDSPQKADIYFKVASMYQRLNQLDESMGFYQKSLSLEENNAIAHYNLSLIYHQKGLIRKSENSLLNAVKFNPNYFMAYNNLASLLSEQSKFKMAEENYRHALRIQSESNEVKMNLANSLHSQTKNDEAIKLYNEVIKIEPDNVKVWESLGTLYHRLQNKEQYVKCFKRALELNPDNEEVRYHLLSAGELEDDGVSAAPAKFVADLFDDYAEKFDSHLVKTLKYKTPEYIFNSVSDKLEKPTNDLNILDLGCGTGLCGKLFSEYSKSMIGVDLSPKMLQKAELLKCYNQLIEGEILDVLKNMENTFELILSADVFVYIGELEKIFQECYRLLPAAGKFVFSVEEKSVDDSYELQQTGRYAHSKSYITKISELVGFTISSFELIDIRMQKNIPVKGYIVVLEK